MEKIIWVSIGINLLAAIALVFISQGSGQDAAGKSMIVLPVILLLLLSGAGYMLLKGNHPGWAVAVTCIPAAIVVLILVFTLLQGFRNK